VGHFACLLPWNPGSFGSGITVVLLWLSGCRIVIGVVVLLLCVHGISVGIVALVLLVDVGHSAMG
jgi:hypothetical protein